MAKRYDFLLLLYTCKELFSRFGKNGTRLTMNEYDIEFNRLVNFTEDGRNMSIGSIGNYTIDNSTSIIKGR